MNIDHPSVPVDPRGQHGSARPSIGAPFLLFTALGAVFAVVLAVWLVATTLAAWALVLAVVVAVCGMVALLAVMSRELDESDNDGPSHDSPRIG